MNYYDLILVLVPFALFGLGGLFTVAGLPLTTAVPLAGAVSAGVVGHAMFVRPPLPRGTSEFTHPGGA